MEKPKQQLILFDFDGTLSHKDSFLEFIKFTHGKFRYYLGLFVLSPILTLYLLRILKNDVSKEFLLRYFYRNKTETELEALGKFFSDEILPKIMKADAMQCLEKHKRNNEKIAVVSGSIDVYLKYWTESQKIDLLCTVLEKRSGKFTGNIEGKNCYGSEKARRIQNQYQIESFSKIISYGNSRGDYEMFELSDEYFFRSFKE